MFQTMKMALPITMTTGEKINFYGSLVCLTGCLVFILVYTAMPFLTRRERWWSSRIGRMLITQAVAVSGLMVFTMIHYLTGVGDEWLRMFRGGFATVIATMMAYQAWLVYRIQARGDGEDE